MKNLKGSNRSEISRENENRGDTDLLITENYECTFCQKQFFTFNETLNHVKSNHHSNESLLVKSRVREWEKQNPELSDLIEKAFNKPSKLSFPCNFCEHESGTFSDLIIHIQTTHKTEC